VKSKFCTIIHESIKEIDREGFNTIQDPHNPFLEYEYIDALESSGCIGPSTNWIPRYIVLYDRQKIIGSIVFFIKLDSYGEYIFDWEWARAYQRAGLRYYPKAVVAIPFTPTTGKRILVHPDYDFENCASIMIDSLMEFCSVENMSSIHCLFLDEQEMDLLTSKGFMPRITHQYHWHNREYSDFVDFLSDLKSSKRKQIRKERRSIEESDLEIKLLKGSEIEKEHIEAMWNFYCETNSRKWGNAYLNRRFFELIEEHFLHRTVMILAKKGDKYVGGSINFAKNSRLFGRYWGTTDHEQFLHFECCYYKLIEYAINNNVKIFEAGAQGEHKFLRGFAAVPIYSSHFIYEPSAKNAIKNYLEKERNYMKNLIISYNSQSPLKYLNKISSYNKYPGIKYV